MDVGKIENIRETLLQSFSEICSGVSRTTGELAGFIRMMDPYVDYFFSGKKGKDSFIGDVVIPSEKNLEFAIGNALVIMNSDTTVHNTVYESLVKVLSLQESVARIVALLELIETYSLNTIIISAKAGDEGKALAAISTEMARMSQTGNGISMKITEKMENLVSSLGTFSSIREKIETLHENSLTTIKLSSDSLFKGLHSEFQRLSGEVLSDYGMISAVNETIGRITEKFQHEDIVRQNLEKIVFAIGESESGDYPSLSPDEIKERQNLFTLLSSLKLEEMGADIAHLRSEMANSLDEVLGVVNIFSETLCSSRNSDGTCKRSDMLDDLSDKLEDLKMKFENYIAVIIKNKEDMLDFLNHTASEISEFISFFHGMMEISKKFKTVILLTLIELSRHSSLRALLGGALSDVRNIPNHINKLVSEGKERYDELSVTLNNAISLYARRFSEQKKVLEESTVMIRKISVQIHESRKYHSDFINESDVKIINVRKLIQDVGTMLDDFSNSGIVFAEEARTVQMISREEMISSHLEHLKIITSYYSSPERTGDYKSMMLVSLAREYMSQRRAEGFVDYF